MNKEIYNQLLNIAKEVFKYLECTDKNRVLSASDIARNLQARTDGVKNKNTWAVYWGNTENLPNKYTVCAGSFKASFDYFAVFAYLAKFETLAGIPVKERFNFTFGDGSERKEKVNALYYNKKTGRATAGAILLHLLNENVAIKPDGTRARVFICISSKLAGPWWYEVNSLDHYKKNYESNVLYLTGDYYNNIIKALRRWDPETNYIYNDICNRASEQIKENDTASAADQIKQEDTTTASSDTTTASSDTATASSDTTTASSNTASEATTTASDGGTSATHGDTTTATPTANQTATPPPPPPMARGAPGSWFPLYLWHFKNMELLKISGQLFKF